MTFEWWHVLVAIVPILPNLWGVWHIWSHDFAGDLPKKAIWLLFCVFLPVLGGLLYLFIGRRLAGARIVKHTPQGDAGDGDSGTGRN